MSRSKHRHRQDLPQHLPPSTDQGLPQQQIKMTQTVAYSGPLPAPVDFQEYDRTLPGAADRILKLTEDQTRHRIDCETRVLESNGINSMVGMVFAFILAMTVVVGGLGLIYLGKSVYGLSTILASLGTLSAVFVVGKHYQKKEREFKYGSVVTKK